MDFPLLYHRWFLYPLTGELYRGFSVLDVFLLFVRIQWMNNGKLLNCVVINHAENYSLDSYIYLLGFPFVCPLVLVINAREIRDNDGDGKGDDQDSGERANATDHLAYAGVGNHVTVPL